MDIRELFNFLSKTPAQKMCNMKQPTCIKCSEEFENSEDLISHARKKHNDFIVCTICYRTAQNSNALNIHMMIMHPECSVCNMRFDTPYTYRWHIQAKEHLNLNNEVLRMNGMSFKRCGECSLIFFNINFYHAHKKALHSSK